MDIIELLNIRKNLEGLGFEHQENCNQFVKRIGQESLVTDNGTDFYIVSRIQADLDTLNHPEDVKYMIEELEKSYGGKTTEEVALDYLAQVNMNNEINLDDYEI